MHPATPAPSTAAQQAIEKYFALTDHPAAVQALLRRVFFEFLRTHPTLSTNEIDTLWAVADLMADLDAARPA